MKIFPLSSYKKENGVLFRVVKFTYFLTVETIHRERNTKIKYYWDKEMDISIL